MKAANLIGIMANPEAPYSDSLGVSRTIPMVSRSQALTSGIYSKDRLLAPEEDATRYQTNES
jgi:hypothetical protein